jgi:5-formyltetrahydrofolate cyclo-ligase
MDDKPTIRKKIIALRERLLPETHVLHCQSITERLLTFPKAQQANVLLSYMSFGAEFNTQFWMSQLLTNRKKLLLPKVNLLTMQLDLYWVHDLKSQIEVGYRGIFEPIVERCERLNSLNEVEFILLPGVAFTREGSRLGYGGGFYDKLLANITHQPTLAAAAFELQIAPFIPQEATDVKVNWIMTEQGIIDCMA